MPRWALPATTAPRWCAPHVQSYAYLEYSCISEPYLALTLTLTLTPTLTLTLTLALTLTLSGLDPVHVGDDDEAAHCGYI